MAVKKAKTKKTTGKKQKKPASKAKQKKGMTRKEFVLKSIEKAGAKGIKTATLVDRTNKKFEYPEGKSSRMRVVNTIRNSDSVVVEDGVVYWKG